MQYKVLASTSPALGSVSVEIGIEEERVYDPGLQWQREHSREKLVAEGPCKGRRVLSEYHRVRLEGSQEKGNRTYNQSIGEEMTVCLEGHLDTGQSPSESTLYLAELRQGLQWPACTQHALRPWVHLKH